MDDVALIALPLCARTPPIKCQHYITCSHCVRTSPTRFQHYITWIIDKCNLINIAIHDQEQNSLAMTFWTNASRSEPVYSLIVNISIESFILHACKVHIIYIIISRRHAKGAISLDSCRLCQPYRLKILLHRQDINKGIRAQWGRSYCHHWSNCNGLTKTDNFPEDSFVINTLDNHYHNW